MPFTEERGWFSYPFFSSGTVTATADTGIIATPLVVDGGCAVRPGYFWVVGSGIAGIETADITIDWYANAAGSGGAIGTTTFDQLTAANLADLEVWPGDVAAFTERVPLFPYHKITYTLAPGGAVSLSFIIYIGYTKYGT